MEPKMSRFGAAPPEKLYARPALTGLPRTAGNSAPKAGTSPTNPTSPEVLTPMCQTTTSTTMIKKKMIKTTS